MFRLTDGGTLPKGLATDSNVVVVPGAFMDVADPTVLVMLTLSQMRAEIERLKKESYERTLFIMCSAQAAIHKTMKTDTTTLYRAAMSDGVPSAKRVWKDLCDDCIIVACCLAALGRELAVALELPRIDHSDGRAFLTVPVYKFV
jgi:hypothetical protein